MEDLDYSLIPETAWDKLTTWYGIAEGSRAIARKVIQWGACVKKLKVSDGLCSPSIIIINSMHMHCQ